MLFRTVSDAFERGDGGLDIRHLEYRRRGSAGRGHGTVDVLDVHTRVREALRDFQERARAVGHLHKEHFGCADGEANRRQRLLRRRRVIHHKMGGAVIAGEWDGGQRPDVDPGIGQRGLSVRQLARLVGQKDRYLLYDGYHTFIIGLCGVKGKRCALYNGFVKALLLILAMSGSAACAAPAAAPVSLPVNSPQLSLARPYAIFTGADHPRLLDLNAPDSPPPTDAADYYAFWAVPASVPPSSIAARRREWNLRGRIIAVGSLKGVLSTGSAADYPGIVLRPGVTRDAVNNRYRVGFELRLAADLVQRIPLPTLDLADFAGGADWIRYWIDECVRNGVAGIQVTLPVDPATASSTRTALAPLAGPNVYLPPPSEVAILLPERSAESEASFRCYAGLRASGVWPNFVSEEQVADRTVSLARFKIIVTPLPPSLATRPKVEDAARRGAIVVSMGKTAQRGVRVLASGYDGQPFLTERRTGDGRWITAKTAPWSLDGAWTPFWEGTLSQAAVPRRRWLEAVTARNVGRITGKYTKPKLAK